MANAIDLDADRHVLTGAEPFPQPVRAQPEADGIGSLLFAGDDFGADLGQRPARIGERQKLIERVGIVQRMQPGRLQRSEEHTSELQSLMRISYAVFCLKKKKNHNTIYHQNTKAQHHTTITKLTHPPIICTTIQKENPSMH